MASTLSHCANILYFIALWHRQHERDAIAEYVPNVPQNVMLITHPLSSGQGLAVPLAVPSLILKTVMKFWYAVPLCNSTFEYDGAKC